MAEPHEQRNAVRTLTKLLELSQRGLLPATFVPALSNLQTALAEDPCVRCHLLALSHDELGVIFDGVADPLQPELAVFFSSTCKGLRIPLRAALDVLRQLHAHAAALGQRMESSCAQVRRFETLELGDNPEYTLLDFRADEMTTIGMLLSFMPVLDGLFFEGNTSVGDVGVQALCEAMRHGCAPSLRTVFLSGVQFGPLGAVTLAAAIGRGAMPNLVEVYMENNDIGDKGAAALGAALRKRPKLKVLEMQCCNIGDAGVASLVDNLGKDDFKALEKLHLDENNLTDVGCAKLVAALSAGALPAIMEFYDKEGEYASTAISEHASTEACDAVDAALQRRLELKGEAASAGGEE